jgi:hypothetical protein
MPAKSQWEVWLAGEPLEYETGLIVDILRTHPYVIIGGIVQENPFFIPPEDMLRELRDEPRLSAFG